MLPRSCSFCTVRGSYFRSSSRSDHALPDAARRPTFRALRGANRDSSTFPHHNSPPHQSAPRSGLLATTGVLVMSDEATRSSVE